MGTAAATLQVTELDPSTLDDADAQALATVANAASAVDAPHRDPVDAAHVRRRLAYGHDMQPTNGLLVASLGDRLIGYAEMDVSHWDNPTHVFIDLETHPDHRGRGVGDALLERVVERARADGRTRALGQGWVDGHRMAFWQRHGFTVGSIAAQRHLVLADLDQPRLATLLADAEAASTGYEIVDLPNPAPDALMHDLVAVSSAINDSPLDDLVLDDDQWSVERVRAFERAMTARHFRLHRLVARRTSDGALGGHSNVVVEEDRPWLGFQEDTAVLAAHRGHRLGIRLKLTMLQRLAQCEPQLRRISTWNAESNRHMIAINDAIGCVVAGRAAELQRAL